jgi:hypothetical protein
LIIFDVADAKVSNNGLTILQQYIFRLEVKMANRRLVFMCISDALDDLLKKSEPVSRGLKEDSSEEIVGGLRLRQLPK